MSELPGILDWALEGLRSWLEDGLAPPGIVTGATQEYRSEMDILGDWLAERCIVSPKLGHIPTAKLYDSYRRFCQVGSLHPLNNRAFGRKLADRGFARAKGTGGVRGFKGIGLRTGSVQPVANIMTARLGNQPTQDPAPQGR